ncbi:LINE-1 retrotransposable element ORF2 protein [Camelus dromedarius]|uniref:LINE-1 retrotransposable element ORF2 protein n=1 Tax=Camelus dromedarius TaxID=9838 RepID=A0A5N4EBN1_CAMDR|nr:LINE-1 retrotransposable element ORF2 protein [Camelus dromedarius]
MEKRNSLHCLWECKLVQPLWKTVWRILKKLKIILPYDLAIPLLNIYPKNIKILIQKDRCIPVFTGALFITAKIRKEPKCSSMDEWMKMWHIYTMEYYSVEK